MTRTIASSNLVALKVPSWKIHFLSEKTPVAKPRYAAMASSIVILRRNSIRTINLSMRYNKHCFHGHLGIIDEPSGARATCHVEDLVWPRELCRIMQVLVFLEYLPKYNKS